MKIAIQKLNKRLFPMVLVFALCLSLICPLIQPASAADLNYEDYILSAEITDDGKHITVSLPIQGTIFTLYTEDMLKISQEQATSITFPASAFESPNYVMYNLQISPSASNYLILSNIPRDTEFNCVITFRGPIVPVDGIVPNSMVIGSPSSIIWFYDSEHQRIKEERRSSFQTDIVDTTGQNRVWRYELDFGLAGVFPDDTGSYLTSASYFRPSFMFQDVQFATSDIYTVSLLSYTLNLNIRSLVSDDSYSDLLASINGLLEAQGLKIDNLTGEVRNLISGTPEQNAAADKVADEMQNASDKIGILGDQLSGVEKPEIGGFNVGVGDLLGDSDLIVNLTAPIRTVWESKTALGILTITITLVLVSWVFFGKKR